ncbi:MAG: hypothetical protein KJ601_04195 [Nanoarchaeota archaeon]|nr:hypothetical protein [Nanoarchaeota archaeon]MBU1704306.1 hypothetical protein [Nanoarchaeota archaeon]
MKKALIITLLFIVLALSANAYTVEMGEYTPSATSLSRAGFTLHKGDYSICANDYRIIPVWFNNNQNYAESITLKLNGANWAQLTGKQMDIPISKSGAAFIELTPLKPGNYTLNLNTKSQRSYLDLPIHLNVEDCYSLDVSFEKESDIVCGCESKQFDLTLKNNGKYKQNVKLDISGIEKYTLSNDTVNVPVGGENTVKVGVACPDAGQYELLATARIADLTFSDSIAIDAISEQDCYSVGIRGKTKVNVYEPGDKIILSVKNNGYQAQTYSVKLESPDWITTETSQISLDKGETSEILLSIKPTSDIEFGYYDVKVTVKADSSEYTHEIKVNYKPENPIIKSVKDFLHYYRFYIYAAPLILLFLLIFIIYVKKKISNRAKKTSSKKLKPKKDEPKKVKSWLGYAYITAVIVFIFSLIIYYLKINGLIPFHVGYILVGAVLMGLIILAIAFRKSKLFSKILLIVIVLLLLAGAGYAVYYFNLISKVKDFFILYWNYVVVGLIFLLVIIGLMNFLGRTVSVKRK